MSEDPHQFYRNILTEFRQMSLPAQRAMLDDIARDLAAAHFVPVFPKRFPTWLEVPAKYFQASARCTRLAITVAVASAASFDGMVQVLYPPTTKVHVGKGKPVLVNRPAFNKRMRMLVVQLMNESAERSFQAAMSRGLTEEQKLIWDRKTTFHDMAGAIGFSVSYGQIPNRRAPKRVMESVRLAPVKIRRASCGAMAWLAAITAETGLAKIELARLTALWDESYDQFRAVAAVRKMYPGARLRLFALEDALSRHLLDCFRETTKSFQFEMRVFDPVKKFPPADRIKVLAAKIKFELKFPAKVAQRFRGDE